MALVIPDKIDLGTRPKAWKSGGGAVVGKAPDQKPATANTSQTMGSDQDKPEVMEPSTIRGEEAGAYSGQDYDKLKDAFG